MKESTAKALIAAYVLCGIVAYGHAYATTKEYVNSFDGKTYVASPAEKAVTGFMAGVLWPLYLSAQLWSKA